MVNRFSLYDFIAILFPGSFFVWALAFFVDAPAFQRAIPLSGGIADTSMLIVIGYVTGLLLQGVSQLFTERILLFWWGGFPSARWLLPDDHRFTQEFKAELSVALLNKFNISLELDPAKSGPRDSVLKRNQEIFYRCYRAVEKLSDLPKRLMLNTGSSVAYLQPSDCWLRSASGNFGPCIDLGSSLILARFSSHVCPCWEQSSVTAEPLKEEKILPERCMTFS